MSAPVTKEISDWLEKLGLPEYADRFSENKIDVLVLRHLTDQDLKDIGVPLGHRRKMLAAIANLDNTTAAAVPPPVSRSAPPVEAAATTAVGERRYLTVMFCDLVGSTGIAAKLNAEEWRDLVGADLDTASVAVVEMGGKVAKKLGDGLMALFGYPVAQENDAERAALAIHWPCCYSERATTGRPQKTGGAISPTIACRNGPCGRVGHGNSVRCRSIWALLKTFAKAPECAMIGGPNGALTAAVEIAGSRCLTEEVSHSV